MESQLLESPRLSRIAKSARACAEQSSYFRRRTDTLTFEEENGVLRVQGTLPSYYLRQILGNLLKKVEGVKRLIDEVQVVSSCGLSSPARKPR